MQFRVMGKFEITSDAGGRVALTRPLVRGVIFALVLYRNTALSAGRMVELLWGSGPEVDRGHALRDCLYSTRQVLPPGRLITDTNVGYRLHIDEHDRVDVDRFRELRRRGRTALGAGEDATAARVLGEAVGMWGEPATGLAAALPQTPAMGSLATGLLQEYRDARAALFQAQLACGEHWQLLPELHTALTGEPADEQLWAMVMLALYRSGDAIGAVRAFQDAQAALAAHVGTEPGPELRSLRRRIEAQDPSLAARVPAVVSPADAGADPRVPPVYGLPADLGDFTGRTGEAAELIGLLSPAADESAVRVAWVNGPPGVGKTALAVHVAHAVTHDFPDGRLFVRLAGLSSSPPSAHAVLGELLFALGVPAQDVPVTMPERTAAYRRALAGRRMLIVFDDAADPDQVRPLLPGSTGCAVIVTSRRRPAGRSMGRTITLEPMEHSDGVKFLTRLVGRARVQAEPEAADQVVAACGGSPRAIRIAGERMAARLR